jgi:hypothetical protein
MRLTHAVAPAPCRVCDMCQTVNFARRTECHRCSAVRPANPQRVSAEPEPPSAVLKVSGVEEHTG